MLDKNTELLRDITLLAKSASTTEEQLTIWKQEKSKRIQLTNKVLM